MIQHMDRRERLSYLYPRDISYLNRFLLDAESSYGSLLVFCPGNVCHHVQHFFI